MTPGAPPPATPAAPIATTVTATHPIADVRWSMRAARALAGATDRQSRALAAAALVPRSDLTGADVLALRALAAIDAVPLDPATVAPAASLRAQVTSRARAVADEARRAYLVADPAWTLVVTADDARTATGPARLADLLAAHHGQVVLLLPLGTWARDIAHHAELATHSHLASPGHVADAGR